MADAAGTIEVTVGRIGRAHGIHGDVGVEVRTDEPELRFAPGNRFAHSGGELVVEELRWHGRRALLRFVGVDTRDAAERLRGIELVARVSSAERPAHPEEYYDHQLRGLTAVTTDGAPLGLVTDVLHLPTQDVLVIAPGGAASAPGASEAADILIPFIEAMVPRVDLEGGTVEIDDRAGLVEAAAARDRPDTTPS